MLYYVYIHHTIVDIGLRNLDIHFGMERRVVFDFINVINEEASLKQVFSVFNYNLFNFDHFLGIYCDVGSY